MGPGKDFEKVLGIMNPPMFEPDQDLLTWGKKVASWVDLISTAAEKGSDKLYKTVFCTLGRQLYDRGLRQAQQSLVDEAQKQGKIDYKQEDQVKAFQQIVNLIAKDSPIAVVTRLIDSFNKVIACKRKPKEDFNRFVARCRGLAAEYLMRVGSSNQSQIGEVLAIILLNNAMITEASLTNAKLRLIGMAEVRAKSNEDKEKPLTFNRSECKKLLRRIHKLKQEIEKIEGEEVLEPGMIKPIHIWYNKMMLDISPLLRQVEENEDVSDVRKAIVSNGPRSILSLDDAVAVLRSLAQSNSKHDQPIAKAQMDSVVDQKILTFFGNQKSNSNKAAENDRDAQTKRFKKHKHDRSPMKQSNSDDRPTKRVRIKDLIGDSCMDCGNEILGRGDYECKNQSCATLKLREAIKRQDGNAERANGTGGSYFPPGSKHTKGKRAE